MVDCALLGSSGPYSQCGPCIIKLVPVSNNGRVDLQAWMRNVNDKLRDAVEWWLGRVADWTSRSQGVVLQCLLPSTSAGSAALAPRDQTSAN